MFKLIISVKKNYYKIGFIFIIIATIMSTIILPNLDTKITSLEKEINDFNDQVLKNVLAWVQYTSIENRIEILCLRSDLIEEYKKDTLLQKIFYQSAILTKAYSGWWSSGEEQKKLMKNAEEKIKGIKNSSNTNEVRMQKIMSLLEVERNDSFIRMNDFQDELEKLQNMLKDKQLNRNKLHSVFALFQIIGLILIALGSIRGKT
jgi:hypothetical protein